MTQQATAPTSRIVDGAEVPAPGEWAIDPDHSSVEFVGRHFMMTKVRGRFVDVSGTVRIGERPEDSSVEVTIGTASVSSGSKERDDHLRSADFFDVDRYPTATFRSTGVDWHGDGTATVIGDLTIRHVTRSVTLEVVYVGTVADPWGDERAIFSATGEVDREDWGLTWNMALEAGGMLVSKRIRIEIDVETVRQG